MSLKVPKPETLKAWLISAGLPSPGWTQHTYLETRAKVLTGPEPAAWEHIYVCSKTGAERVWGNENRSSYADHGIN